MLESSKLPYSYWYIAMYLMTCSKKSLSALQMQRELSHKRYEPIWAMMHKIRRVMSKLQLTESIGGFAELDDAFFVVKTPANKINKPGRGSNRTAPVLVMAQTGPVRPTRNKHSKHSSFVKIHMKVMDNLKAESISEEVVSKMDPDTIVYSDGYKGYSRLSQVVNHSAIRIEPKLADKVLPWVHTCISNAKRLILGIFHAVGLAYLQNYLDEYTFKTNQRHDNMILFELLLTSAVSLTWY
jgi:transposase-like protein